ncbi:MAG: ABC transporter substrate-binding protein [Caldilineaceae bacterium SB0668_bin_21]|nr:ABC transporter substrate-binding protein [Caldilineaceae bacterium SB0668_bin_21]MYC20064.1 ABC transporter substrate-binding protein [Caldilineaceae bacterium SB0662_bin_25]
MDCFPLHILHGIGKFTCNTTIRRNTMTKRFLLAFAALFVLVLAAACAPVAPAAMEEATGADSMMGGTLRIALPADVTSLDLHKTSRGDDALVVGQWFNATLITQNSDGEYIPYLAESWEFSDDGLTWTFHLRDDVKFHNGDPVTAHDFVWTYERALDPDLASPGTGRRLSGMTFEAPDDYTVVFNFPAPAISLLQFLNWGYMAPMSQRAVEELGAEYELNPVGTGPYKVVEVRPGEGVSMERWDEYNWGPEFFEGANTGPYNFDRIEFSILPEEATRIAALEAGDIDYVNGISNPLDVAILEAAGVTVQQAPYGQVRMVYLQNHVPPFDDVRVRQALNYAVNREEITQIVTDGADQVSRGPISPGMLGYDPEIEEQCGYHFDLDRAKELMQEAGYTYGDDGMLITPDGEPFSLTLIGEPVDSGTAYMEVLQSMWRELGLDITLESTEPSILYPRLTERDYQMGYGRRGGWTSYDYLYAIYHSSTGRDLPGSMRSAVDDPTTDALLEKNRAMASDNPELQGSINELYCHIAGQSYSVWISDGVFRPSIGPRVQGTVAGPAFAGRPVYFSNAYIAPEDR